MGINQRSMIRSQLFYLKAIFVPVFLFCHLFIFESAKPFVHAHEEITLPSIFINDLDVSTLTQDEIITMIENQLNEYQNRKIIVHVNDQLFETTLSEFHPKVKEDLNQLVEEILTLGKDLELMQQISQVNESQYYQFMIEYTYDYEELEKWARAIEKEVYIEKIEPKFQRISSAELKLDEGRDGQILVVEQLLEELSKQLNESSMNAVEVDANIMIDPRELDVEELKTIDSKISSYSTEYLAGIPRAKNVELAASKINHTILMPGEEFSYYKKVAPIDAAHGYVNATIFLNGKPIPGIGGGICQVSSTLYNAQLKAGIVATERQNHSLPVRYVPLGQDATIADNVIDLKFINTHEYPILIFTYANYGSLTVEFWSNSMALNGITYKPKTVIYDGGLKADTTLYGYNAEGEVVYEQFLHTSVYKKKAH